MERGTREQVQKRADGCCEYCKLPQEAAEWPFHIDHVIARVHGGLSDFDNLCWSCTQCNLHKGTNFASLDPDSGDRTNLFHPRTDVWSEHFVLAINGRLLGKTATGRATARLLASNGTPQLDLRRELIEQGRYPMG